MADYTTIQKKRNLVVGIFVFIAIASLVALIFLFGELPVAVTKLRSFTIYVQFSTAPGVAKNTPVRFCGYQIGRVITVMRPEVLEDKITGQAYYQTKVILAIDEEYTNIPSNADIKLIRRGLGSSYIDMYADPAVSLVALDSNRPGTKFLSEGMLLQGTTGTSSEFVPEDLQKKLDALVVSFRQLLDNSNSILGNKENQENIRNVLANLSDATKQATATLKEIEKFSSAGAKTMANADARLTDVSVSLVETSVELNNTLVELRGVFEKVKNGDGTLAKLINDNRLYENLLDSSEELDATLVELHSLIVQSKAKGIPIKLK